MAWQGKFEGLGIQYLLILLLVTHISTCSGVDGEWMDLLAFLGLVVMGKPIKQGKSFV